MKRTWFFTGTDTGVGKTTVAVGWTRFLAGTGLSVRAVKPICSGDRLDAIALNEAQSALEDLDQLNPWHFSAPLAPDQAAALEGKLVSCEAVVDFLKSAQDGIGELVVEGAGGLLSPMGGGFDNRDLLTAINGIPVVVCSNRLGAINQCRLVWEALPPGIRERAFIVLNSRSRRDTASSTNAVALSQWIPRERIFVLPRMSKAHLASSHSSWDSTFRLWLSATS